MIHAVAAGGPVVMALFTFLSGCITFEFCSRRPPSYHLLPFETCKKITCAIFYDIIIDRCNLFQHSAAERPAPFACPAPCPNYLPPCISPTLVAL